jgi:hypothetical protein
MENIKNDVEYIELDDMVDDTFSFDGEAFGFIKNIFKKNSNPNAISKQDLVNYLNRVSIELESNIEYFNKLLTIEGIDNHKTKILNIFKTATNNRSTTSAVMYMVNSLTSIRNTLNSKFIPAVSKCCNDNVIVTNLSGADLIAIKVLQDLSTIVNYSLDFLNVATSMDGTLVDYKSYKDNIEKDIFTFITLVKNYASAFKDVPNEMVKLKNSVFNPETDDISVGTIIFNNTRSNLIINSRNNFTYNPIYMWNVKRFDNLTEEYRLNHIKRQNIENKLILLQQKMDTGDVVNISKLEKEINYYNNELALVQGMINRYDRAVEFASKQN